MRPAIRGSHEPQYRLFETRSQQSISHDSSTEPIDIAWPHTTNRHQSRTVWAPRLLLHRALAAACRPSPVRHAEGGRSVRKRDPAVYRPLCPPPGVTSGAPCRQSAPRKRLPATGRVSGPWRAYRRWPVGRHSVSGEDPIYPAYVITFQLPQHAPQHAVRRLARPAQGAANSGQHGHLSARSSHIPAYIEIITKG